MVGAFLVISVVLFIVADVVVRLCIKALRDKRKRREREEALAVSLKLDFTREAKTLKRAEVKDPTARILCVDDEDVILDSFRKVLVLDGYCVDTVQTGQEALGLIQTQNYDFVFTDLRMPAMDGVDVVKSVKHMRPDIDVVIVTGYATIESAVECMKFGAMDYVQKPFTEDELLAFVKKALIKRQDRISNQLKPKVHIAHASEPERVRPGEFSIPGGLLISQGHCWAGLGQDGSVKVGIDDFANKLLGRVDAVDFPQVGTTVKAGQPLFCLGQKGRKVQFLAPVSGKVLKTNTALREGIGALATTPYHRNWVCVIEGDSLDAEVPTLKIGKSAVALFQEDIERFRAFLRTTAASKASPEGPPDETLCVGAFEKLDATQFDTATREFFGR